MSPSIKLLTGLAAAALIAHATYLFERQALLASLGDKAAIIMSANGVTDGAARWTSDSGWTDRTARLSGTADAATRAQIKAQLASRPGIHDTIWTNPAQ